MACMASLPFLSFLYRWREKERKGKEGGQWRTWPPCLLSLSLEREGPSPHHTRSLSHLFSSERERERGPGGWTMAYVASLPPLSLSLSLSFLSRKRERKREGGVATHAPPPLPLLRSLCRSLAKEKKSEGRDSLLLYRGRERGQWHVWPLCPLSLGREREGDGATRAPSPVSTFFLPRFLAKAKEKAGRGGMHASPPSPSTPSLSL